MKNPIARRSITSVGIIGVVLLGLGTQGAGGAGAGPLPGGFISKSLVDGTNVQVRLYDESVNVQQAVTNIQTSREVWASGKVRVTINGTAEGGSIWGGYIVGCQLNFGASGEAGLGVDYSAAAGTATPSAPASGGFSLSPGEAKFVPIISTTSGDDTAYKWYDVQDYTFIGRTGGVSYSQEKFGIDGCAGYAQAKAKVQVTVHTESVTGVITLYGKPFSLG